ncbi:hypothetical protein ACEOWJ_002228 [Bacillus cereus]|uniref:hypothetical protein n=1 Tax=Bacillus TaxID=1386 RepID=UPI000553C320|nr:hypothetical protein [Bacillus sp. UNC322MFChir4.1]
MKWGIEAIKNIEFNTAENYTYIPFEDEYQSTMWTYLSLSYLQNFLESSGLSREDILELLPVSFKGVIWGSLETEDIDFIRRLTKPKRCLEIVEQFNLMESAALYEPNLEYKLRWLKVRWQKGYYVFANC